MPKIRVVRVDLSSQAQVTAQRPVRGDRLINSSACRWTVGPDGRSVQPDHQRTPKAAVSWGGSFCFPLMAPRVNPDCDEVATNQYWFALRDSQSFSFANLRELAANLRSSRREQSIGTLFTFQLPRVLRLHPTPPCLEAPDLSSSLSRPTQK